MKKLNKIITFFVVITVLYSSGISIAKAGVFDWFSDQDSDVFANHVVSPVTSYLNPNSQLLDTSQENAENLPIVQDSLLVSTNPITAPQKPTVTSRPLTTSQIRELVVPATAYSSTPDQTDSTPFITALGTTVRDGIIAANFLPFGAKIKIPELYGDKIFVVEDRMNRRFWHRIDIWFPDRQSALEFGFRRVKIQILES